MTERASRLQHLVGSVVLAGALLGLTLLLTSPVVARPAARVLATIDSALDPERADDAVLRVPSLQGIHDGLPVFLLAESPEARPVAHVAAYGTDDDGSRGSRRRMGVHAVCVR